MPYAEGRVFYDADSHIMETNDWLAGFADPDVRGPASSDAHRAGEEAPGQPRRVLYLRMAQPPGL